MSDKLIYPPDENPQPQAHASELQAFSPQSVNLDYRQLADEDEDGIDLRRYGYALLRYKWLLVVMLLLGIAGAAAAWRRGVLTYTAEGSLWVEVGRGRTGADFAPIQTEGLLESSAWVELLRSYAVLDSVVLAERLYVDAADELAPAFRSFELADSLRPGGYELEVEPDGSNYTLTTSEGILVERGQLGSAVGRGVGFIWTPPAGSFPPNATVAFSVAAPRDAARRLGASLVTQMDQAGNFIQLSLSGPNPERLASVLNTLLERHVTVAADLKRSKLDENLKTIEIQLASTEDSLAAAEQDLEGFRVRTITLPTDRSTPIAPGLQQTLSPVFDRFFQMKVELDEVRRDRQRMQQVVDEISQSGVRIEALEAIPAAASSSELRGLLTELVAARAQVRALRDRYSDDFPPVQELLTRIGTLEAETIPFVARGILLQLGVREGQLQSLVNSSSQDLTTIPPRVIEEGRLARRVAITETLYNDLKSRVETARLASASSIPDVRILDRAAVPRIPTGDTRFRFAAFLLFGFIGAGVGGAILLDRFDGRFRYAGDVGRDIGLDILGSIPRIEGAKRRATPGAVNAAQALEAFRELRIHIGFAYGAAGPLTLTITSPSEGDGKSLISSNLAVAFAEVGRRTLLIDGDTRRGDAHRLLGRKRSPGLVDYLREQPGGNLIQTTDIKNLDFVGSGSRGASTPELLASSRMVHFIGTLKRSYEVIIIDSPPLAAGGDALILGSLTGNLAVVIRTGTTDKHLTQAKLDQLTRLPIRILGAILNDVEPSKGHGYYYANYLPSYEPVPEGDDADGVQLLPG